MDHLIIGRQLKHYVTPQAVDCTGWDKQTLTEIAKEKITELKARLEEISSLHDQRIESLENIEDDFELHRKIWEYEFQAEKYYIGLWMRYWNSFINKPKVTPGRLTADDIQKAKQFPIDQLYFGNLRKVSGKLVGLCPFHKEKTPSFTIFSDGGFYCFGCSAYGDSITYLMETKNLSFPEAVRSLV